MTYYTQETQGKKKVTKKNTAKLKYIFIFFREFFNFLL